MRKPDWKVTIESTAPGDFPYRITNTVFVRAFTRRGARRAARKMCFGLPPIVFKVVRRLGT